ncbi:Low-density lipoprotein receptor-related protein [Halotydeus destructor]|nr:Low-density lipoprotein receptor-related protein [Halotydeus destructor]
MVPASAKGLDTFLRLDGWGKGVAYINGINIGRYWPDEGPQVTLYVPHVWLRPDSANYIYVFETERAPCRSRSECVVSFTESHVLDKTTALNVPRRGVWGLYDAFYESYKELKSHVPDSSMSEILQVQNRTKCIPSEKVCDQIKDCPNRDDESEQLCSCQSEPGYFRCRGVESKCIPPAWTCDKVQDCPHGDDEIDSSCSARVVHSCLGPQNQAYSYPSFNNKTIPVSWKCDGEQDCPKGDDEKFCPTAYPKAKCPEGQYNCLESSTCLDKSLLCNHVADCPQQDDERDCKSTLPDSENITLNTVPTKA